MRMIPNSLAVAAGAVVALVPAWTWAQGQVDPEGYAYSPHMMGWGAGWHGMMLGPLFMIFVLAVAIAVAILLVRWLRGPSQATSARQTPADRAPLDILKERFARGEIDKAEYEERRHVLGE